jgi:hypothetical protein
MLREVQVRPEHADAYPSLTPGRWYTAAAIAGLVKGTRIIKEGREVTFTGRVLQSEHFEFRGGCVRRGCWAGMHTRRIDRHPPGGTQRAG